MSWILIWNLHSIILGTVPPTQKLVCFVLYLKIINMVLKNNIYILYKLSKELKNSIKI